MSRDKKKPGRNERCPCGSGKKYKRCCLHKDEQAASEALAEQAAEAEKRAEAARFAPNQAARFLSRSAPGAPSLGAGPRDAGPLGAGPLGAGPLGAAGGTGLSMLRCGFTPAAAEAVARGSELPGCETHPWVRAQLRDRLKLGPGNKPPRVSISSVRGMNTEAIVQELERAGVAIDMSGFADLARGHGSAWALSETFEAAPSADPEFVGLATCELWRRLLADRPSLEMLDELMQEGYDAFEERDTQRACETWLRMWDGVLSALPPEVQTLRQADALFPGLNSLGNMRGDFETELHNLALRDQDMARRGLEISERMAARFSADTTNRGLRRQQAELLFMLGKTREGEALLDQVIADYPDHPGAYASLADHLGHGFPGPGRPVDLPRAIAVLERALARPVDDAEDWDLPERLRDFKEMNRSDRAAR